MKMEYIPDRRMVCVQVYSGDTDEERKDFMHRAELFCISVEDKPCHAGMPYANTFDIIGEADVILSFMIRVMGIEPLEAIQEYTWSKAK